MPIYIVKAKVTQWVTQEVEADSSEEALDKFESDGEVDGMIVELSECQYTDHQELRDEELRYEKKHKQTEGDNK